MCTRCSIFQLPVLSDFGSPPKGHTIKCSKWEEQMKCSCWRSRATYLSCWATLLLWDPPLLIKQVFYWHAKSPPVSHPSHDGNLNVQPSTRATVKQQCLMWPDQVKNHICKGGSLILVSLESASVSSLRSEALQGKTSALKIACRRCITGCKCEV